METAAAETLLGNCPVEALRRAWLEGGALQASAVEREVLALCTERARQIRDLADELASGRAVLAEISGAPSRPDAPASAMPEDQVAALEGDIADLRTRIARLERGPERPETAETLIALRDRLAAAEADLAQASASKAPTAAETSAQTQAVAPERTAPSPADVPLPDTARAAPERADATAAPVATVLAPAETSTAEITADTPPNPAPLTGTTQAPPRQTQTALPPDRPTDWQVVHAVRRGEGPWQVTLQGTREIALSVPGASAGAPPSIRWQVVSDPPVTVPVGARLPDGLILKEVSAEGVSLRDPLTPDAAPRYLPFTNDPSPGALDWVVTKLGEDGS